MWTYLRKRILQSALPLVAVVLGVFVLARLTGDPSKLYLPLNATDQMRADFAARNGFDKSIWAQMGDYFLGVLQFDFGESLRTGESAATMVLRAFPATLQLAGTTMVIAIVVAIVVGSWAAIKPNGIADRIVVMRKGAFEQVGTPTEIYDNPSTKYVAGFIGEMNMFEQGGKTIAVRPEDVTVAPGKQFEGTITSVMNMGHYNQVFLHSAQHGDFKAFLNKGGETQYVEGDTVHYGFAKVREYPND